MLSLLFEQGFCVGVSFTLLLTLKRFYFFRQKWTYLPFLITSAISIKRVPGIFGHSLRKSNLFSCTEKWKTFCCNSIFLEDLTLNVSMYYLKWFFIRILESFLCVVVNLCRKPFLIDGQFILTANVF